MLGMHSLTCVFSQSSITFLHFVYSSYVAEAACSAAAAPSVLCQCEHWRNSLFQRRDTEVVGRMNHSTLMLETGFCIVRASGLKV